MDISTIEHESITSENRGALATHMEKFDSFEAAALDGMDLKGQMGKPFKVPESMDKLPDDTSRADFTSQANKLLGRTIPKDLDGLKDVNFKEGLEDDAEMDDQFVGLVKQWAVDEGVSTQSLGKMVRLMNGPLSDHLTQSGEAAKLAATEQAKADHVVKLKACNDALTSHADFGNTEKLDQQTILLHRALKDNVSLSVEDANEVAEFLRDREGATNPVVRRLLINQLAPLAAEGSNEQGKGGNKAPAARTAKEQMPKTGAALGW